MRVRVDELMERTGVKFGTSGARGLVEDMTDPVCYAYTAGFLQYLEEIGELREKGEPVALAGDLRPSTTRILRAVARAVKDRGYRPVNCGRIPSPALALYGLVHGMPAIMVTGSHIPADRNGIKFNRKSGEILKSDEAAIRKQVVSFDETFRAAEEDLPEENIDARIEYLHRYTRAFPEGCLDGMKLGVYQHSAVGRDLLIEIFSFLGADVTPLGFSAEFIPVDTEAVAERDRRLAREWAAENRFDAIVSTDGDSDRPLLADERGEWLRGDVLGILAARYLGADSVSVPVSCNTALEKSGWFRDVRRTRIGSPYVIASMLEAVEEGWKRVVGFEANGGFLTAADFPAGRRPLRALPTRDAVLPMLAALLLAHNGGKPLSRLVGELPARFTASGLLRDCPAEISRPLVESLADPAVFREKFGDRFPDPVAVDRTDGTRLTLADGAILHFRPSGNAPELRCYAEADSPQRAEEMVQEALRSVALLRP